MPARAYRWATAAYGFGLLAGPALWRTFDAYHRRTAAAGLGFLTGFLFCWLLFALLGTEVFEFSRRRALVLTAAVSVGGGVLWLLPEGWSFQGHGLAGVGIWLACTLLFPLVALATWPGSSRRWRIGVPVAVVTVALAWPPFLHTEASYERHRLGFEAKGLVLPQVSGYYVSMFRHQSPISRVPMIDIGYTADGEIDNSGDSDLIVSEWIWTPETAGCAGWASLVEHPPPNGECVQLADSREKLMDAGGTTVFGKYGDVAIAVYAPRLGTGEVSMPFPPDKLETLFASFHAASDQELLQIMAL